MHDWIDFFYFLLSAFCGLSPLFGVKLLKVEPFPLNNIEAQDKF